VLIIIARPRFLSSDKFACGADPQNGQRRRADLQVGALRHPDDFGNIACSVKHEPAAGIADARSEVAVGKL
jgi:hypothetical protein